jgi:hypothetical protein
MLMFMSKFHCEYILRVFCIRLDHSDVLAHLFSLCETHPDGNVGFCCPRRESFDELGFKQTTKFVSAGPLVIDVLRFIVSDVSEDRREQRGWCSAVSDVSEDRGEQRGRCSPVSSGDLRDVLKYMVREQSESRALTEYSQVTIARPESVSDIS